MSSNEGQETPVVETGDGYVKDSGQQNNQGSFVPEEGKIDKRHGDPDDPEGRNSGQKAADTRAEKYGEKIHYKDNQ